MNRIKVDQTEIESEIAAGNLMFQVHHKFDLKILKYTKACEYNNAWTDLTRMCRGLIVNSKMEIISRPYSKFFNFEQVQDESIFEQEYEVWEKLDGSLGISYYYDGMWGIATVGSFDSPQARRATAILNSKYDHFLAYLRPELTYIFEIIYPTNRIVVNYEKEDDIYLTGIIDTETGKSASLILNPGFNTAKYFGKHQGLKKIYQLKTENLENKEGYVLKFKNGFITKVKFKNYIETHRIVTNVSSYDVWNRLRVGEDFNGILELIPDEFYEWLKNLENKLLSNYANVEKNHKNLLRELSAKTNTEKELIFAILKENSFSRKLLFQILKGQNYEDTIWKSIKPEYELPFSKS